MHSLSRVSISYWKPVATALTCRCNGSFLDRFSLRNIVNGEKNCNLAAVLYCIEMALSNGFVISTAIECLLFIVVYSGIWQLVGEMRTLLGNI